MNEARLAEVLCFRSQNCYSTRMTDCPQTKMKCPLDEREGAGGNKSRNAADEEDCAPNVVLEYQSPVIDEVEFSVISCGRNSRHKIAAGFAADESPPISEGHRRE